MATLQETSIDLIKSVQNKIKEDYSQKCVSSLDGDARALAETDIARSAAILGNQLLQERLAHLSWWCTVCTAGTGDKNKSTFFIKIETDNHTPIFTSDVIITKEHA